MSVTYEQAPEAEVGKMIAEVMQQHHPLLNGAGVTIEALFARNYDKDGQAEPAIVVRGQACAAKISITNLSDRVRGIADAKLIIDAEYGWNRLAESRRIAMIDHELCHLEPAVDKDGVPKLDDHGRPKLKIRHHDWELTGFADVAERHGEAALEVHQIVRWEESYGQLALFPLKGLAEVKLTVKHIPEPPASTPAEAPAE